ncbi:hypothetical protein D3C76_1041060 [compost metagenome]
MLLDQSVATQDLLQVIGIQGPINDLGELGTCFRRIAVADGLDQQILERDIVKRLTQYIEDFAA